MDSNTAANNITERNMVTVMLERRDFGTVIGSPSLMSTSLILTLIPTGKKS